MSPLPRRRSSEGPKNFVFAACVRTCLEVAGSLHAPTPTRVPRTFLGSPIGRVRGTVLHAAGVYKNQRRLQKSGWYNMVNPILPHKDINKIVLDRGWGNILEQFLVDF